MSLGLDEEVLLDILDSSLLICPPICETLEISPFHDFPDGCGTITTQNSMEYKVGACGQIEGFCEGEGEVFSEKSKDHGSPVFPNGVELAASSLVKQEIEDDGEEELPEMPVVNHKPPSPRQGFSLPGLKDPADAVKHEVMDEDTTVQPCLLPNRLNPPNLMGKEQRCPSRKRVSPVDDFHGRNSPRLVETQDKQSGQSETVPNNHKTDNNYEQGKRLKQSENNGNQIAFSIKDQNKKKKSIGLSSGNIKSVVSSRNAGVEKERVKVVVLGLMSPRTEWIEAVETCQSMAGVKTNKEMKPGCAMKTKCNCLVDNSDARRKVRDILRIFHGVHRKLVQADEKKSKGRVDSSMQINAALKRFKDNGMYINVKKMMGHIPGVEVGDLFNYRVELDIIGLHKPLQSGIDFVKEDDKLIAISIVASGRYDNVVENSDVLVYVGQGGNVAGGCKQLEDQKLQGGNLALKNSINKKNPVRVIRGFKERKQIRGKRVTIPTYIYDGLYTVERCWQERGPHGKLIYKFELKRVPHQPELTWKKLKKVKKPKKSKTLEGFVDDISQGKEEIPICAVNTIDDEKPSSFNYITSVVYPDWCRPLPLEGCDCKDGCADSKHCSCALKNGGEIPYNYSGALVEEKSLVYECGPSCKCPPTCHNRVSQHGIKLPLEIFKTESRGWGVRSLSSIPSGSFVCEYIGELLDEKEAEQRIGSDEYLFDIGRNYNDPTLREGISALMPDMPSSCSDVVENVGFTLDAAKFANIGRFINHSCSPNLVAQNVLYDHEDKRIPHIMMFASENIPPLQELTYHYNYTIDKVFDSEGNIKKKSCRCGSSECIGRMY